MSKKVCLKIIFINLALRSLRQLSNYIFQLTSILTNIFLIKIILEDLYPIFKTNSHFIYTVWTIAVDIDLILRKLLLKNLLFLQIRFQKIMLSVTEKLHFKIKNRIRFHIHSYLYDMNGKS